MMQRRPRRKLTLSIEVRLVSEMKKRALEAGRDLSERRRRLTYLKCSKSKEVSVSRPDVAQRPAALS
jgi:hypothetical protein